MHAIEFILLELLSLQKAATIVLSTDFIENSPKSIVVPGNIFDFIIYNTERKCTIYQLIYKIVFYPAQELFSRRIITIYFYFEVMYLSVLKNRTVYTCFLKLQSSKRIKSFEILIK